MIRLFVRLLRANFVFIRASKTAVKIFLARQHDIQGAKFFLFSGRFSAGRRTKIRAVSLHNGIKYAPKIIFGNEVSLEDDCHIAAINYIEIGERTLIASKVFITDHFHGHYKVDGFSVPPFRRPLYSPGPVKIGKGCWLGEGVVVLPNVEIGDNTIIGANSTVTKSIPCNSVAVGSPAVVIWRAE